MLARNLVNAIKRAWDNETCYPLVKSKWDTQTPELGQCAVTALLINDKYGGHILHNAEYDHYWNQLPDGRQIDLTKKQFAIRKSLSGTIVNRQQILNSRNAKKFKTSQRYGLLKERVSALVPSLI